MLSASRSTIETRPYEKGRPLRVRYRHNPIASEIPLAIDYPRPDEPGRFSGGDAGGHYICAVVVVDRYTLWVEGELREAVLGALKEASSRIPWDIKTLQTERGSEFLNDHLRSRQGKKNDNAHVEGSIGNIVRKELGYLRPLR